MAINKTYSSVLLRWKPEFDGGSDQKFTIMVNNKIEIEALSDNFLITSINQYICVLIYFLYYLSY